MDFIAKSNSSGCSAGRRVDILGFCQLISVQVPAEQDEHVNGLRLQLMLPNHCPTQQNR